MIRELVRTGKARFEFRHFLGHRNTDFAAEAMECAADQSGNAFWQFHDEYMTNAAMRAPGTLRSRAAQYAEEIGLDVEQFQQCLDDQTHRERIDREHNQARRDGVRLTPTIYVDGRNAGIALVSITQAVEDATP